LQDHTPQRKTLCDKQKESKVQTTPGLKINY